MMKTTIYLPESDMQELKAAARRRGQSEAALVREGVRLVLSVERGRVMPTFGLLDAEPMTAAEIDATLAVGLGADGLGADGLDG